MVMPKSVFITGAKAGIGLAFVRHFVTADENGHTVQHVFASGRKVNDVKELVEMAQKHKNLHLLDLDVSNDQQIQNAVNYVSGVVGNDGLTLLINNAAMCDTDGKFPNINRNLINQHFDVNATAPLILTQAFLPLLKKAADKQPSSPMSITKAAVINISSEGGSLHMKMPPGFDPNLFGMYSYSASKAALNMLTKYLSYNLKEHGILIAAMCPGYVDTNMSRPFTERMRSNKNQEIPSVVDESKMITPDESVELVTKIMKRLKEQHNGGYFRRNGQKIENYDYASAENDES